MVSAFQFQCGERRLSITLLIAGVPLPMRFFGDAPLDVPLVTFSLVCRQKPLWALHAALSQDVGSEQSFDQ
jgi:hypothetical protein